MSAPGRPVVGIFGLTGCAGDQLQILNCEDQLVEIAAKMDIAHWVMTQSENDRACELDVAFVEGVVATERDLATLRKVRDRARFLVAIGTCAVWGGLPAMRNDLPREVLQREVYRGDWANLDTVEARPATDFVPFDFCLPGCPMERHEFLRLVRAILAGTIPELTTKPVCHECKIRENLCRVIYFKEMCCGAMTRSGCGARCPSHGVPCAGCRGPVSEPNYDANIAMFSDRNITREEIGRRMAKFSAPVWMTLGLEQEADRDDS